MEIGKFVKRTKNPKRIVLPIKIPTQIPNRVTEPVKVPLTKPLRNNDAQQN